MRRREVVWSGICILFLICCMLSGLAQAPANRTALHTRYQLEANAMSWTWKDEWATPEHCAAGLRGNGPYHVEIAFGIYEQRIIRIRDEKDALRYVIQGHAHTTFVIDGDMLYYADYGDISNGATVVAVNLKTKTERWRTHLRGIGTVCHSAYSNRVVLHVNNEVVMVRGWEAVGKYVEYLEAATGRILAHRIFNEPIDGLSVSISLDRAIYRPDETAHFTVMLSNEGKAREIKYALDRLDAAMIMLVEPNGSEMYLQRPRQAQPLQTAMLKIGERLPVLEWSLPLGKPAADAWHHFFDNAEYAPVKTPDGRAVKYSNPSIAQLPKPMLPAPGIYSLYAIYSGAGTFPRLYSNYVSFTIDPSTVPPPASPAMLPLGSGYRDHAFQFLMPSPSGQYIAGILPKGFGGDDTVRIFDLGTQRAWRQSLQGYNFGWWLPDESALLIGSIERDSDSAPKRYWFDLTKTNFDGRSRRLLRVEGFVYDAELLPDSSGVILVTGYDHHPGKTEDEYGEWRTQVQLFDLNTERIRPVWTSPITTQLYGFRHDWLSVRKVNGDWVLAHHAVGTDPVSYWINLRTGQEVNGDDAKGKDNYAYSLDGNYVVANGVLRRARRWPLKGTSMAGKVLAGLKLPSDEVSYCWSPDSQKLLVRIWDAEQHLTDHCATIYDTATGRKIATLDEKNVPAKSWPIDWVGNAAILMEQREDGGNSSRFFLITPGVPKMSVKANDVLFQVVWKALP
ncbi:MAG: WD40 repeat domain-containing protein [Armatimonadota bacterium]